MRTTKRANAVGIVQQLLDEPYRFEFFQAITLIEKILIERGIPQTQVLTDYLQFRNSTKQGFPASQIEALDIEASTDSGDSLRPSAANLIDALDRGELDRICITPAFFGLLGKTVRANKLGRKICLDIKKYSVGESIRFKRINWHKPISSASSFSRPI